MATLIDLNHGWTCEKASHIIILQVITFKGSKFQLNLPINLKFWYISKLSPLKTYMPY